VPENLTGLYLEHGFLRAGIQQLLAAARPTWTKKADNIVTGLLPPFDTIVVAGNALTSTGHPGFNALLALDALQPTGITTLLADPYGIIAALGALARVNPEAVVQTLEGGALERVGLTFNLSGIPQANRPAMKVKITTEDGEVIEQTVAGGHIWRYPLQLGKLASVEVRTQARGLTVGGKGKVKLNVEGGSAGLIFDARGRHLPLAMTVRGRAEQMPMWVAESTGDPVIPIDEQLLAGEQPDGDITLPDAAAVKGRRGRRAAKPSAPDKAAKPRRGLFGRRRPQAAADVEPDLELGDLDLDTSAMPEGRGAKPKDKAKDDIMSELDELRRG
jgi:hypothetical protein